MKKKPEYSYEADECDCMECTGVMPIDHLKEELDECELDLKIAKRRASVLFEEFSKFQGSYKKLNELKGIAVNLREEHDKIAKLQKQLTIIKCNMLIYENPNANVIQ